MDESNDSAAKRPGGREVPNHCEALMTLNAKSSPPIGKQLAREEGKMPFDVIFQIRL
jgi:hypothetical protein